MTITRVAITHALADAAFAQRLADDMQRAGITATRLGPEQSFSDINAALAQCEALVAVISPAGLQTRWVQDALAIGLTRQTMGGLAALVTVEAAACDPRALPAGWGGVPLIPAGDEATTLGKLRALLATAAPLAPPRPPTGPMFPPTGPQRPPTGGGRAYAPPGSPPPGQHAPPVAPPTYAPPPGYYAPPGGYYAPYPVAYPPTPVTHVRKPLIGMIASASAIIVGFIIVFFGYTISHFVYDSLVFALPLLLFIVHSFAIATAIRFRNWGRLVGLGLPMLAIVVLPLMDLVVISHYFFNVIYDFTELLLVDSAFAFILGFVGIRVPLAAPDGLTPREALYWMWPASFRRWVFSAWWPRWVLAGAAFVLTLPIGFLIAHFLIY